MMLQPENGQLLSSSTEQSTGLIFQKIEKRLGQNEEKINAVILCKKSLQHKHYCQWHILHLKSNGLSVVLLIFTIFFQKATDQINIIFPALI